MKIVFLVLLGLHSAAAVTHSLKNIVTASSQVPNFPEFVIVGMVDDVQIQHYDSNTTRLVPKQDWANRVTEDNPQHWERYTARCLGLQQIFKGYIETLKHRFNQTGGVHIFQWVGGCEWDDETGEVSGFRQVGYDGEDFLSWDVKTNTWIAPKQQAVITKNSWNNDKALMAHYKYLLSQDCPDWLKKLVNYGRSSLMRTELPSVSLLQKTPSSPVSCFATGFYPDRAMIFWRKDGEELHQDVELGEILPNHDGSFQMNVDLNLSSVTPEDWRRYECVFHLSGVKDDIITKLDKTAIQTNWGKTGDGRDGGFPLGAVIGGVVVLLLLVVGIVGFFLWKKNKKGKDGVQPANTTDASSSSLSSSVEVQNTGL
ncbi:major histocompatibility complex class I-related gene protein-like [Scomber scombrus]|uniref:major histocompatibility complex class I-related gene protein-like n=1 Tax=Scomber scombrus TaxID=13677 RepID=UPI002DDB8453|nr:major histocompatibility complex class I-related gene protein-like [Scomber scombrus]